MDVDVERWAPIAEAPVYEVSTHGRVRRGAFLVESWPNKKGYHQVNLEFPGATPTLRALAPMVLRTFTGPRPSRRHLCNHKDGNKDNNRSANLEWVTPSESVAHAWATGLIPRARRRRRLERAGQQSFLALCG